MGTTPLGIPYPEDTDQVQQGATAMEAIATSVDGLLRIPQRPMGAFLYSTAVVLVQAAPHYVVPWTTALWQNGGAWTSGSRITVPAGGAGLWSFAAGFELVGQGNAVLVGTRLGCFLLKNGAVLTSSSEILPAAPAGTGLVYTSQMDVSALPVVAGDYFEIATFYRLPPGGSGTPVFQAPQASATQLSNWFSGRQDAL